MTVKQIIKEVNRVLQPNGVLLLKLPNFDLILDQYKKNNRKFFRLNKNFGVDSVTWSWKNYGVDVNIQNIVAMMFCGYWNKSYGDHFSRSINMNEDPYHGPPAFPMMF